MNNPGVFLFMGALLLSLMGCAAHRAYPEPLPGALYPPASYVAGVPFYPQEKYQCGPAALAGALNFAGYRITPEEISESVYLAELRGTLKTDMARFARGYEEEGGSVEEVQGDLELLKKHIGEGHPLIVFVDLGIWNFRKGHYMLIVGYDDRRGGVIAYSGVEKDKFIPYNGFVRTWKRGGYWALRIVRRD